MRQETDSLGGIAVPENALWGGQTQRACDNFAISGIPVGHSGRAFQRSGARAGASEARLRAGEPWARRLVLRTPCVEGITACPEAARAALDRSTAVVTALVPWIGYDRAADLAKRILAEDLSVGTVLAEAEDVPQDARALAADPLALALSQGASGSA